MPVDGEEEYENVVGGKLKLKGVSLKKAHKKKKKKRSRSEHRLEAWARRTVALLCRLDVQEGHGKGE